MLQNESDPQAEVDVDEDVPLYTPEPGERQLTFRAVAAGSMLGALVCAMNIYFGLQTGWSIGGSLIAAILSFSFFSAFTKVTKGPAFTRLETNIAQTAGSAAGSMTSAAGLLAAVPAMGMLGHEFGYWELTLWAASIAWLGVFYAVPLRRQMVLVEKLRFPTGTATAETIMAMFSEGGDAIAKSQSLVGWGIGAAAFTLLAFFFPAIGHPAEAALPVLALIAGTAVFTLFYNDERQSRLTTFALLLLAEGAVLYMAQTMTGAPAKDWLPLAALGTASAYGFSLLVNPLMYGAGILIGPRVAASLLLGAILGWAVLAPIVESQGWVTGPTMSYGEGARGSILWPGVAIMVADALTSLAMSWRTILNTFKGTGADGEAVEDPNDAIPNSWWIIGLGIATCFTVAAAWYLFEIHPLMTVLAVGLSSVLATIAVRSTGETDINPIGGMGKVTQLIYGGIAPGQMTTNLMTAAITGSGASQAGDMMQDLKTGWLLGASPRRQLIAQLIGITAGIFVCVPIYVLFDTVYDIGGEKLPAPAAHAWKAMAELLSVGLDAMPQYAIYAVVAGCVFGVLMPVLKKVFDNPKWLPSGLAVGIAMIVPAYYACAMFVGMVIYQIWVKLDRSRAEALGFAVASGLIAGEGLMGVITAVLQLIGIQGG